MYIKYLQLINFRSYKELNIELARGVNVFIGDNAQGKTNILESIYYCSLAKSHRTNKDKDLIKWNEDNSYIKLYVHKQRLDKKIEIKIFKEGKKGVKINSIKINKIADLIGIFNVVIFSPEDLKIIKDSPSYRRKFLDIELCQLSNRYYYNLVQYNKVLNERNALLRKYEDKFLGIMEIYEDQLSKFGSEIIKDRIKYIDKLNNIGKTIHKDITYGNEQINFRYLTNIKKEYIERELKQLLSANRKKDVDRKTTSFGPHRDDFSVDINGIDVRNFGSQGQQRTAVLTMKFASLEIIKEDTGEYPVLLLDDVLSELDSKRQKYVLSSINNVQTIITSTGLEDVKDYLSPESKIFTVINGSIVHE